MLTPSRLSPFLLALACFAGPATSQESASFKLQHHAFNAGGDPREGVMPASASFVLSLDSLGECLLTPGMRAGGYRMEGGFGWAYAPPREVQRVRFLDAGTIRWDPDRAAGSYDIYRDRISRLAALGFGDCAQHGLAEPSASDVDAPPVGDGFFHLVTVRNRLGEEGTRGFSTDGAERTGTPCP